MRLVFVFVSEAAGEIIGRYGGVQDLLSALRAFPDNKAIASHCCGALWSLAVSGMVVSLIQCIVGPCQSSHEKVPVE